MRLEVSDLAFRFGHGGGHSGGHDGAWIFKEVTFGLGTGDVLAILGPNGRGKTTLLRCILGLLKPTRGRIDRHGELAHVPQSLEAVFSFSVRDMVVMGRARRLGLFGAPAREDWQAADVAIAKLGLEPLAPRPFTSLSGGERQLVLIARALASDADILVLDEPASALDFRNQQVMLTTLKDLVRRDRLTLIFTTHEPQHALALASHGLLMETEGRHRFGAAEEVFTEEALTGLYGVPLRRLAFDHASARHTAVVPVFS